MSMKLARRLKHESAVACVDWVHEVRAEDKEAIADKFKTLPPEDCQKLAAYLYAIMDAPDVAILAGQSTPWVWRAAKKYRDIVAASRTARLETFRDMAQKKAMKIVDSIDISQIPDDRKTRAVKELMEAADLADVSAKMEKRKDDREDTAELIFRIRTHTKPEGRKDLVRLQEKKELLGEGKIIDIDHQSVIEASEQEQ